MLFRSIVVMAAGRIVGELPAGVGEEDVIAAAVGHIAAPRAAANAGASL